MIILGSNKILAPIQMALSNKNLWERKLKLITSQAKRMKQIYGMMVEIEIAKHLFFSNMLE